METIEINYTQNALKLISDDFGVSTMEFHYYDCTCQQCYDRHFPCDIESECPYCITVRNLLDRGRAYEWSTPFDLSTLLPYSMYESWDDDKKYSNFADDELVIAHCDHYDCNNIVSRRFYDSHCGYCKEHYAEWESDQESDDYDQDDEDSEYSDRTYGDWDHDMGEVLDVREYGHTTEAWIAPDGKLHFVPDYNTYGIGHYETAQELGLGSTDSAERKGYIHVSTYYSTRYPFHYVPSNYTDDQVNTAMLFCDAHSWDYPEFIVEWIAANQDDDCTDDSDIVCIEIKSMQNLSTSWLCMTRAERDKFYPLSGD